MQKDNDKKKGVVRTIAIPPETLAAIRIGGDMLQLAESITKAVNLWGPIGTTEPVDLGDMQRHLGDAYTVLGRLLKDVITLREAMIKQDEVAELSINQGELK